MSIYERLKAKMDNPEIIDRIMASKKSYSPSKGVKKTSSKSLMVERLKAKLGSKPYNPSGVKASGYDSQKALKVRNEMKERETNGIHTPLKELTFTPPRADKYDSKKAAKVREEQLHKYHNSSNLYYR